MNNSWGFVFDMDGLIIDTEPFWRVAEIRAFNQVGISLTENDCRKTMGMRLDEVVAYWQAQFPEKPFDPERIQEEILGLMEDFIRADGEFLPGVPQALDRIHEVGFRIGLASSSPMRLINATLDRLRIRHFFSDIRSAEKLEFGKPHPAIFIDSCNALGIPPHRIWVVEDSFHGVVAALAAKCNVIAIPDSSSANQERFKAANVQLESMEFFKLNDYVK